MIEFTLTEMFIVTFINAATFYTAGWFHRRLHDKRALAVRKSVNAYITYGECIKKGMRNEHRMDRN